MWKISHTGLAATIRLRWVRVCVANNIWCLSSWGTTTSWSDHPETGPPTRPRTWARTLHPGWTPPQPSQDTPLRARTPPLWAGTPLRARTLSPPDWDPSQGPSPLDWDLSQGQDPFPSRLGPLSGPLPSGLGPLSGPGPFPLQTGTPLRARTPSAPDWAPSQGQDPLPSGL